MLRVSRWASIAWVLAAAARAATFTVDSTTDAVDAMPGDGVCATAAGACTLRAAVQESNASTGADSIVLPAGRYAITLAGAAEDAGATGDLDVRGDLSLVGAGRETTFVSASRLDRVIDAEGIRFTLSDMTLEDGFLAPPDTCEGVNLRIATCDATIERLRSRHGSTLSSGETIECRGIGAWIAGGSIQGRQIEVVRNTGCASGAGILLAATGALEDVLVAENAQTCTEVRWGSGGGALVAQASLSDPPAVLTRWTIRGNEAMNGGGASLTACVLRDSLVVGNVARHGVGLIGPFGGGLIVGNDVSLENVTISGNRAVGLRWPDYAGAGGLYFDQMVNRLRLRHVTITRNETTGQAGAAMFLGYDVTLGHCVILGNSKPEVLGSLDLVAPILLPDDTEGDVLVQGDPAFHLVASEARLAPLADNGGPTWTHALLPGSPALERGLLGPCLGADDRPLAGDQRALQRVVDADVDGEARCDLGSYEEQVPCGGPDTDGDGAPDACDCAPGDPSTWLSAFAPTLRVSRVGAVTPRLAWSDAFSMSGTGGLHDVASDGIVAMRVAGAARAPCIARDVDALGLDDSRDLAGQDVYYLVRARTACLVPGGGSGWGSDSLGRERPTCP